MRIIRGVDPEPAADLRPGAMHPVARGRQDAFQLSTSLPFPDRIRAVHEGRRVSVPSRVEGFGWLLRRKTVNGVRLRIELKQHGALNPKRDLADREQGHGRALMRT